MPCAVTYGVAGTAVGALLGGTLAGVGTVGTFGLNAPLIPAEVAAGALIGGATGTLVGGAIDNRDEIAASLRSIGAKIRSVALGALLLLTTNNALPTTPTNPCGDKPPADQADCRGPQRDRKDTVRVRTKDASEKPKKDD